jgi:hypothetical protein
MSKKNRKIAPEGEASEVVTEASEVVTEAATQEPKAPAVPKAPTYFVQDSNGVQYKFDKRLQLPKKAAVVGNVTIDGVETPFQVTTNKGFTPEANVIAYSWFTLPNGLMGYITHDYLVTPEVGMAYTLHEGVANRKNPDRIAKNDIVGDGRIEKFKAAMLAKKSVPAGEAPAETPAEDSVEA